jgi:heme exporter protein CcmD
MSDFWAMSGYGPYVWSAYGITLVVLVFNYWSAGRQLKRNLERVRQTTPEVEAARRPKVRQI